MAITMILRALTGELRGTEFAFRETAHAILGRSRSCTLRLPGDASVSRQHCAIELDNYGAWVRDLGSLNGTLINGENIGVGPRSAASNGNDTVCQPPRHALNDGDELRICNNIFAVCLYEVNCGQETVGQTSDEWHMAICC